MAGRLRLLWLEGGRLRKLRIRIARLLLPSELAFTNYEVAVVGNVLEVLTKRLGPENKARWAVFWTRYKMGMLKEDK